MRHRTLPLIVGALLGSCSGSPVTVAPTAETFPPLTVGGEIVPGGVALVDGDYAWTVLVPPTVGPETYRIAVVAPNDIWFMGNGIRHWNGQALEESLAPRASVNQFVSSATAVPFALNDVAVVSPTDIWVCGSRLMHWDGRAWSDRTSEVSADTVLFECGIAATADRLFAVVNGGTRARDGDAPWRTVNGFYYEQGTATRLDMNSGNNRGQEQCVEIGPSGELTIFGWGVLREVHDPSPSPQSPVPADRVDVRLGLRNMLDCNRIVRVGSTYHSAAYESGGDNRVFFATATFPGDFHVVATLEGGMPGLLGGNGSSNALVGLAVQATGSLGVIRASDDQNHPLSFLVEAKGSTARLLPDRLWGWEAAAIAFDGDTVLVAAQGGSVLKGVRR